MSSTSEKVLAILIASTVLPAISRTKDELNVIQQSGSPGSLQRLSAYDFMRLRSVILKLMLSTLVCSDPALPPVSLSMGSESVKSKSSWMTSSDRLTDVMLMVSVKLSTIKPPSISSVAHSMSTGSVVSGV